MGSHRGDGQKDLGLRAISQVKLTSHGAYLAAAAAAAAKSLQSCPTLCDPIESRPWDSPGKNTGVGCHFLLQCMKVKSESDVTQLCPTLATPWTAAHQAPPSMGFSRQKYWSGVPLRVQVQMGYLGADPRKQVGNLVSILLGSLETRVIPPKGQGS